MLNITHPKFFIAAENDPWAKATKISHGNAAEPRELVIYFYTGRHGAELFNSPYQDQFLRALLDFVEKLS